MTLRRFARSSVLLAIAAGCTPTDDDPDGDTDVVVPTFCDNRDLPTADFLSADGEAELGAIAGDFTVQTTTGEYTFSEAFTGCTSYVFFVHFPGVTDAIMGTLMDPLISDAPANVEYFLLSDDADAGARTAFLDDMADALEDSLQEVLAGPPGRDAWRERFHFVTDRATAADGSLGAFIDTMVRLSSDPGERVDLGERGSAPVPLPIVFGIDRAQRFDAGGSLSPYVGAPTSELGMAAWLPHFYDYRFALDARLSDDDGVTVVPVLDEVTVGRVFTLPAELPDADTMAGFDTLEFDVTIDCQLVNPFACSEWDRIASIAWCVDGSECTDRRELARWITPYWRRGRQRYALDASPMLAFLRDGGTQTMRIELGPSWERGTEWHAAVSMRLSDAGGPRAVAAVPAFGGGDFGGTYNDRTPVAFTPPAGTTRAEVVALVTGHGQTGGNNCAEWCDHRHTFDVDGTDLPTIAHEGSGIGSGLGCAEQASAGVMPGQWGNWAQARAYWCPGLGVPPTRVDITSQVTPGEQSELGYRGAFGVGSPAGGSIALSSYVVFYEDP